MLLNVVGQGAQRREDATILFIVGAQLKAIALGDFQRDFQRIDGVEAEAGAEQRRFRVNLFRAYPLEIDGRDDELGELTLGRILNCRHKEKRYKIRLDFEGRNPSTAVRCGLLIRIPTSA